MIPCLYLKEGKGSVKGVRREWPERYLRLGGGHTGRVDRRGPESLLAQAGKQAGIHDIICYGMAWRGRERWRVGVVWFSLVQHCRY